MSFELRRYLFQAVIVFLIIIVFALVVRFTFNGGEDNWVCRNGQWVMHGHPSAPAPSTPCY